MVNAVLTQRRSGQASRGKAAGALLLGVKRRDWRARPQAAHWLGRELAWRSEVAYWAVSPEKKAHECNRGEQRRGLRKPARLRSAKLLDATYRFVCESRVCDRSRDGLRLALARDIRLPPRLAVHIDETGEVRESSGGEARQSASGYTPPRRQTLSKPATDTR
ncbi:MAG TPA: hypothetical protein VF886_04110 [Roseiarcus sp.]